MTEIIGPLIGVVLIAVIHGPGTREAARGEVGRGGPMGIRTRHTQASDAAWQAGHVAAAGWNRWSILVAVLTVALSVAAREANAAARAA